tara:strand:- start:219 stop:692 length:474 start_codon:yes stop_codon:yes gene_type:complete
MDEYLEELIDDLRGSLRRAEHTYYVSLKYTRTVDVIRTLIERFITTYTLSAEVILTYLRCKKKADERPDNLIEMLEVIKEALPDEELIKGFEKLLFYRRVMRNEYSGEEEYRRHVTMRTTIEGEEHAFDIDILGELYHEIHGFVQHVMRIVYEKKEE